ncbi:MAG: gamma-glutamyltransferase, partial [Acetobacteraceae bacterium]
AFKAHMLIEAYKLAFGHLDRLGHATDPDAVCTAMLAGAAMRAEREAIGPRATDGPAMARNYGETTQCAAVDARGRVATLIHSLYRPFGARVLSPTTGLIANDRGASFTDGANAPAPLARPRHTLVNVLAESPDGGLYALGTPGAQAQTQTNLQVLARLFADPAALADAVLAPRWSFIGGRGLACEADMAEPTLDSLRRLGHAIGVRPPRDWLMGSVSLAAFRDGLCHAVADDRRMAIALAL